MRFRFAAGAFLVTTAAVILALSGGRSDNAARAQTPTSSHGCSKSPQKATGGFSARLTTPGHHPSKWRYTYIPDQGKKAWAALWPIKITASRGGRAISGGKISYQFLFNGRIVACRTVLKPYVPRFRSGVFRDRIDWPERSVGIPLTFRIVVRTRYGLRNMDYAVRVSPRKK